jgi:CRP-like cAMP-binding protein
MADSPDPRRNHLLAALPDAEWHRWKLQLEAVELPLGQMLYESGTLLNFLYFPTTAVVSLQYVMDGGVSAEIAKVGAEGVVGISVFMGAEATTSRAVVQGAGRAVRIPAQTVKEEFVRSAAAMQLLLRYTQALITQMAQTAVCNRHHPLDKQLCRWLLLSLDRLPGRDVEATQEQVAEGLGARRESVTESVFKLERAGLIHYTRHAIAVLDRPGLEMRACDCAAAVKREYARLLPRGFAP